MSNFGHVERVTKEIGGKTYTFKSLLETRWAVWCQLRKEQGIIVDWEYETVEAKVETKTGDIMTYRPDFLIKEKGANIWFYEETKGWLQQKDAKKMRLFAQQYENPLTLIFANLNPTSKNASLRAQYGRAKRLEKLLEANGGRIIYKANRDIFKPIKHLFI